MMQARYKLMLLLLFITFSYERIYAQASSPDQHIIVELIMPENIAFSLRDVNNLKGSGILNVMQWKNRIIVYAVSPNPEQLLKAFKKEYPKVPMVLFANPFYNFNRKYCSNKVTAKQWDNIILSANLVADPKLQQEYLNYHATQFQKWPEISQGFCNANFQQLLVFKSGRQLMLVISIPKGESLDKLNPLTTKNNPRVDDWNNMMKKYQEGIEETKKGETWVFFKSIDEKKFNK